MIFTPFSPPKQYRVPEPDKEFTYEYAETLVSKDNTPTIFIEGSDRGAPGSPIGPIDIGNNGTLVNQVEYLVTANDISGGEDATLTLSIYDGEDTGDDLIYTASDTTSTARNLEVTGRQVLDSEITDVSKNVFIKLELVIAAP